MGGTWHGYEGLWVGLWVNRTVGDCGWVGLYMGTKDCGWDCGYAGLWTGWTCGYVELWVNE